MQEPKRLIVSENDELMLALTGARRQLPSDRRLAAIARRLAQAGVAFPADSGALVTPHTPTLPAAAPAASNARKLVLGLTIVGLAALAALIGVRHMTSAPPAASRMAASVEPASAEVMDSPALAPSARALKTPALVAGGVDNPPAPPLAPPNLGASKAAESTARALPSPASATRKTPSIPGVTRAEPGYTRKAKSVSPRATRSASAVSSSARPAGPTTYETPREAATPLSEVELLKQTRDSLISDPLQAYALTERCRALYPQGAFEQEREFMALTALARIGREREARALAASFRQRYPRSAYLPQLDRMFGVE